MREMLLEDKSTVDLNLPINPDDGDDNYGCGTNGGGIGIMNIMLVSVTERIREIGIRMAIGAKRWDIRLQFLMEALILSLLGGLIGVIFGIAGVYILPKLTSISAELSTFYVILPFSFSGIVGLLFGFFPAYKASLLNPINALRYE